ncbi:unnamed protein product [Symbiodinium sp. CCMP2592]|nr:unnamed protein product [Symbiodinium sp. CCMP2592]
MYAQNHDSNSAGNGLLGPQGQLPNGVSSGSNEQAANGASRDLPGDNPNVFDPAPPRDAQRPTRTQEAVTQALRAGDHPPYGSGAMLDGDMQAQQISGMPRLPSGAIGTPQTPRSAVRVQEFFSAESRTSNAGQEQQGVRWMARFTEFLRTTASRGATGMDRVLDSFGLHHGNAGGQVVRSRAAGELQQINFSPPEELPGEPNLPPMPLSWTTATAQEQPLFSRRQVEQMRQSVRENPVIYGAGSEIESERSSRLQQEVQRQMEEYTARYQEHVLRLEREVEQRVVLFRYLGKPVYHKASMYQQAVTLKYHCNLAYHKAPMYLLMVILKYHCNLVYHKAPTYLLMVTLKYRCNLAYHKAPTYLLMVILKYRCNLAYHKAPTYLLMVILKYRCNLAYHKAPTYLLMVILKYRCNLAYHKALVYLKGALKLRIVGMPQVIKVKDQMALLAGGMAQLQQAMLKQMTVGKDEDRSPEAVKPGVSQLPALPQVKAESSSIDIADWLEMLAAPMSDLSDGSASWWKKVCEQATKSYQAWTDAGPMDKLAISPPKDPSLEDGRWGRVNSRAASMILLALHESVRSEMVARRLTGSTVSLLFRLMTLYQPGGEAERSRILNNLQNPPQETDAQKVVEALRSWDRWLRRCKELSLATPDPTILAKGLNTMVRRLVDQHADMGFRTNLVRSTLQVDTRPSYTTIDTYYKHLMGECEALAVASSSLSTQTLTTAPLKPEPKIKPMRTDNKNGNNTPAPPPPPKPPTTSTTPSPSEGQDANKGNGEKKDVPCRFFGKTFRGCARASKCPFLHSWEGLEKERPTRCLACGGKHMAKECPNKKGGSPTSTANARTPSTTRNGNEQNGATSSTTTTRAVRIEEKPEGEKNEATASTPTTTTELKEVLADVGKMLKAMTAVTTIKHVKVQDDPLWAKIKMLSAKLGYDEEEGTGGLLDSGASHPMRVATTQEYDESIPVKVTLAGEEERVLRQNGQGTVLLKPGEAEDSQPIVPLGAIIRDLGCNLQWKDDGIKLFHPQRGQVRVHIRNNCPEVSAKEAHRLIKELEMVQMKTLNDQVTSLSARLEVLQKEEKRAWNELLKDFMESGDRGLLHRAVLLSPVTKDLPADIQAMMITGFDVNNGEAYLKGLPLTRRKRKALLASNDWVVRMFRGRSDGDDGFEKMIAKGGKVLLDVDVADSKMMDINGASPLYKLLLWAAAKGKISDIVGSPPETTWTTSMTPTRGPGSIHQRTKDYPYGTPGLSVLQQHKINLDTACVAKQMLLWMCAMTKARRNVGFALEFPADVVPMREEEKDYLSFWKTEMWKSFRSVSGITTATFNQGALGHPAVRPTTTAATYPEVLELDGDFDYDDGCLPTSLLNREALRKWSPYFEALMAKSIVNYVPQSAMDEEEAVSCGARLSKLTKEQRDAWMLHLLNDHQPYRADCSVCLNAQATGYQHRRRKQPQLYALALDLAGPYKVRGRDMDFDDYKYIMVAAYKCPKEYMDAKALEAVEKEFSMDEYEPSDAEDEFGLVEDEKDGADPASGGEDEVKEPAGPATLDEAVEELTEALSV